MRRVGNVEIPQQAFIAVLEAGLSDSLRRTVEDSALFSFGLFSVRVTLSRKGRFIEDPFEWMFVSAMRTISRMAFG